MAMQAQRSTTTSEGGLARFGLSLANWSERWFPDPLVFALLGILVVFRRGLVPATNRPPIWPFRAARTSGRWFPSPCRW